jgi:hypothetical protein
LAGGFAGTGLELSHRKADRAVGWARPATGAEKIARLDTGPEDWVLFGFEKGAALRDGVAPARRVGLFLDPWGVKEGSPGLKLIDAAIQWCVEEQTVEVALSTFLDEYASSISGESGS